ncbi:hypothetical protein ACOMICROBIO_GDFFDHBD_03000 [Vibrio sp. B1REV9]|uniref:hypothetical protein n=1 Tax=Vibrio sp. B1REV9 TaxID=2751179 RepID=UPI001AF07590|nr:hypothetical protein [Vibrio sp. B1REV9]CAE6937683.1 hypothetical protein ACOMICROBIO_GDFFDHBD_03000 [Vibrio sp. B1REV9]
MNNGLLIGGLFIISILGKCYASVAPWGDELDNCTAESNSIKFDLNKVTGDKFLVGQHHLMLIFLGGWYAKKGIYKQGGYTGMTPRIDIMSKAGNVAVSVYDRDFIAEGDI